MADDARRRRRRSTTPRVTLDDIGGMDEVKHRLQMSFVAPLRSPELRQAFQLTLRGGLLLWGPPGCGKTLVARAVAGELGAEFINVGLNDVLSMWLGDSEKNIHKVFERARGQRPALLFFDELDALGHKRTGFSNTTGRNVVAQLLVEMEGVDADNDGLYLLAATNQPWAVDPALRRPGRFDRSILVLPPDDAARRAILAHHLRDRPVAPLDLGPVAAMTDGFSGADLNLVCRSAAELALMDSLHAGTVRPIDDSHLQAAVRGLRPSTDAWMDLARTFAVEASSANEYNELFDYWHRRGTHQDPAGSPGAAGVGPAVCLQCGQPLAPSDQAGVDA